MQRLILLRHAEAEQSHSGGDFNRALTASGLAAARAIGEHLAARGLVPDLALVSTAKRTVQTWEAAQPAFPAARLELVPELYNAPAKILLAAAKRADAAHVMVLAHNPGLQVLALELTVRAGAVKQATLGLHSFPPATAAAFRFENDAVMFETLITG